MNVCSKCCSYLCCGAFFQIVYFISTVFQGLLGCLIQTMQALLEKVPPNFHCYNEETDTWDDCTKKEICNGNIPKDHYKYDEEQDEYIDNWVD
jgi:hypothetical protein